MQKALVEIEIPEGFELGSTDYRPIRHTEEGDCIEVVIYLMRIEDEEL